MRGVKPDDTEKIAMVQEVGAKSGAAAAKLAAMLAASD
jgi:predicted Na+-dependent transporter